MRKRFQRLLSTQRAKMIEADLLYFAEHHLPLPGIESKAERTALTAQLTDSDRRIEYVRAVAAREISGKRKDPTSDLFDPVRAAILLKDEGEYENACWMVFLFAHFSKHSAGGWLLPKEVYRARGRDGFWDWESVSADPQAFRDWLRENESRLLGLPTGFGNHRKFQSLRHDAAGGGTGAVVESYVNWVKAHGSHRDLIESAVSSAEGDPRAAFDLLYRSMSDVHGFGRLGKFDYLTMIAKVGLAPIEAPHPYISGSTGPISGANELFGPASGSVQNERAAALADYIGIPMQGMEDALCNWQKSTDRYVHFRG